MPLFIVILIYIYITEGLLKSPSNFIAGRPKAAFCFGSVVILDVMCRYLSLFLYIYIYKNNDK